MLLGLCLFHLIFESKDRLVGLIGFALLGVVMLFVRELLDFYVDYNHLNRASPTMLIGEALFHQP
jgi:hypothetical protein